jgi:hypothetical protein
MALQITYELRNISTVGDLRQPARIGNSMEIYLVGYHPLFASDPRDKIYALLCLADNDLGITPDYRKPSKRR